MPDEFLKRLAKAEYNDTFISKHLEQRQKGTYKVLYNIVNGKFGCLSCAERKSDKKQVAIKSFTNQPVVIGFGIKTPQQAQEMSKISDGIVIGSSIVEEIKKSKSYKNISNNDLKFIKKFITKF